MTRGIRHVYLVLMALVFIAAAIAFVVALPLHPLVAYFVVPATVAVEFLMYFCHVRCSKKERVRYPLVPPEGRGDVYFPRSKIPRPIHEDMRRVEEQRRKFAKLDRLRRRKKQR